MVGNLLTGGFHVIMRPHYHTIRLSPGVCEEIVARYRDNKKFEYIDSMGDNDSLFRSHVLVSDWSAMAIEYALGLEKPVLFIDLPRRIRNKNWQELGIEPIEAAIRERVGSILSPTSLELAAERIRGLLQRPEALSECIAVLRKQLVYNPGSSVSAASEEIARLADQRAALRETGTFNEG